MIIRGRQQGRALGYVRNITFATALLYIAALHHCVHAVPIATSAGEAPRFKTEPEIAPEQATGVAKLKLNHPEVALKEVKLKRFESETGASQDIGISSIKAIKQASATKNEAPGVP